MLERNYYPIPSINNGIDISEIIYPKNITEIQEEFHYKRRLLLFPY